jgi:hypothetical protein
MTLDKSGGQRNRIDRKLVPMPRLTYILEHRSAYEPSRKHPDPRGSQKTDTSGNRTCPPCVCLAGTRGTWPGMLADGSDSVAEACFPS